MARLEGSRWRPTIKDVAAEAGVSLKTVSRVLNLEPGVAAATSLKVKAAAERLGFQRNETAAQLRRLDQSSRLIGLVIEDLANPFYSTLARGVENVVRGAGYLLMVASSDEDPTVERDVLRALLTRRVDGLIIVPTGPDQSFLLPEIVGGTAIVFVDRPALSGRADVVMAANAEGAVQGVTHLIDFGHRAIGYLGDDQVIATARDRYLGYCDAMASAGLVPDEAFVRLGLHDTAAAEAAVNELLEGEPAPTALFTSNNRITVGALRAMRRHPTPVALVGFDDFELADVVDPGITVVAQDVGAMGRTAAELLLSRLRSAERPVTKVVLGTRLVVRGSGERRP
jgi:LacI family transcriptional regulator